METNFMAPLPLLIQHLELGPNAVLEGPSREDISSRSSLKQCVQLDHVHITLWGFSMLTLGSNIYAWIWCSLSLSHTHTHTHTHNWPKKHFLSLGPQTSLPLPCLSSVKSSPPSTLLFFLSLTTYVFKKLNLNHLKREFRPVEWKRVRGSALEDVYLIQQLYHWPSV